MCQPQPETAYRSLEEMDDIFRNTTGVFDVVHRAKPSVTPNRYDKNGNLVISYLDTDEHRRRSSIAQQAGVAPTEKSAIENKPRAGQDEAYKIEGGFGGADNGSSSGKSG